MILSGGELDGKRVLSQHAIELISTPQYVPRRPNPLLRLRRQDRLLPTPRRPLPPAQILGHTGFTGTCFWIDPADDAFFILLTNAVHPDGKGKVLALRRASSTSLATAPLGPAPTTKPSGLRTQHSGLDVLTGIDVLKKDNFKQLEGKHLAIITNHTGRDRDGNRTIDLLANAKNCKVICLFSPEHGLYGKVDEKVGNAIDEKTHLKVYSLYGQTRRPTDEMLAGVDTLLFDIQDIGAASILIPPP